jgi:hypothetical protein
VNEIRYSLAMFFNLVLWHFPGHEGRAVEFKRRQPDRRCHATGIDLNNVLHGPRCQEHGVPDRRPAGDAEYVYQKTQKWIG